MSGLIDLTSSTDFIESVDLVIPSDKWDPHVVQVQDLMSGPVVRAISFPYSGPKKYPLDGKKSGKWYTHLANTLIQFRWALEKKFPGQKIPAMAPDDPSGVMAAINMLAPPKTKPEEAGEESPQAKSDIIREFQTFFSKPQPVIGQLYSGEVNGEMNEALAAAAQAAESVIAKAIDNTSANGALFNSKDKTFNTSVSDLQTALSLIQKHKGQEKSSIGSKNRLLLLASVIEDCQIKNKPYGFTILTDGEIKNLIRRHFNKLPDSAFTEVFAILKRMLEEKFEHECGMLASDQEIFIKSSIEDALTFIKSRARKGVLASQ